MGSKKKATRVFGKGVGENQRRRREQHRGRPKYSIARRKEHQQRQLMLKIRKVYSKLAPRNKCLKKSTFICNLQLTNTIKLRIKRLNITNCEGYRLVNLNNLQTHIDQITLHTCQCPEAISIASVGKPPISVLAETRNLGLASVFAVQCKGCKKKFTFDTSPKLPGSQRFDINVRAVWGCMSTGNGPAHLTEMLGTMNSPGLSQPSFTKIEEEISAWWLSALEENMLQAGIEERNIAIQKGQYHQEVPAITVITDGGWSKRTHKHSYNALGGVAIIIGKETGKLLHIGVRNKYCYICHTAKTRNVEPREHRCFKNWDSDSQSMEADIIVEGFKLAESRHGLRYMNVIGDGDSSVFARIKEEVPIWGRDVQKVECANHTCKCLRSNLEKLVSSNPLYKGKHHLSRKTRVQLVSCVRCAIRVRTKEVECKTRSRSEAIKYLQKDIRNSVPHVFGNHQNCTDFCKASKSSNFSAQQNYTDPGTQSSDEIASVLEDQISFWDEGTSKEALELSRFGSNMNYEDIEQYIIQDVSLIVNKIAEKADRLIGNTTTNLAECWMHIRCKFDGGKVHNLCNKGSWHARCYGGALRMNYGPQWSPTVWEKATVSQPGTYFERVFRRQEEKLKHSKKHQKKPEVRKERWLKKVSKNKVSNTKKAVQSYGPQAVDVSEDVTTEALDTLKAEFLAKYVNISAQQIIQIQNSTIQQSSSGLWHSERKKRLTASNFGKIVRRNPSIPTTKLTQSLLYSKFKGNRHTRNGLLEERTTIEEYKLKKAEENDNVTVDSCGLVVDETNNFLAASPDGIVKTSKGESGLIEIKNLLHNKPVNLFQAAGNKSFCLELKSGVLRLKENHDYFHQCHGLLNICKFPWIDFVVRTLNPYQLFIQRIYRDPLLWSNVMLPKLSAFYHNVLLPELACPREGKSPGIREPGVWFKPSASLVCAAAAPKQRRGRQRKRKQREDTESDSESHVPDVVPGPSTKKRTTRSSAQVVKFVGRRIRHEWIVDEATDQRQWYDGTVLDLVKGKDGQLGTVYNVLYDGDDDTFEVEHLVEDYQSKSLHFLDL